MAMNDFYRVMLDVSALVTHGSDFTRRIAAESKRRAAEPALRFAEEAALHPVAIVAVGGAQQPVGRLMALQSAIARAVHMAAALPQLRFRLPRAARLLDARLKQ